MPDGGATTSDAVELESVEKPTGGPGRLPVLVSPL